MFHRTLRAQSVVMAGALVTILLLVLAAAPAHSQVPIAAPAAPYSLSGDVPEDQSRPAVAAGEGGFLAVWTDHRGGGGISGRRVVADGSSPEGSPFSITSTPAEQRDVDLAYNPATNAYLAVWDDRRQEGYPFLYGQLIHHDGSFIGGNFEVSGDHSYKTDPAEVQVATCARACHRPPTDPGTGSSARSPLCR